MGPLAGRLEGTHWGQVGLLPHGGGPRGWLLASLGHPCLGALGPHAGGVVGRKGPSLGSEASLLAPTWVWGPRLCTDKWGVWQDPSPTWGWSNLGPDP